MMIRYYSLLLFLMCNLLFAQGERKIVNFEFEGYNLQGVLNIPKDQTPKGVVIIVHGSGKTNAVKQEWHLDVRNAILNAGYATYMWDKMGCGKSEGVFNYNQTVQNSADEVIAAITSLKKQKIKGSDRIGLWGISRAGWINPIVINKYKNISFWISVSGVGPKESFVYLFKENLKIEDVPKDSIHILQNELKESYRITHSGGSFKDYMNATKNLRKNKFLKRFNGGRVVTEKGYLAYQKEFMKMPFDYKTNLQIYVQDFESKLSKINCPVLALFGEKDTQVDWKKTKALYQKTLGEATHFTTKSFPNCNHNLFECRTGGFYEFQDNNLPWIRSESFLLTITSWLINFDKKM
ncbi:alpha/beta hydrolase [uncultured Tenacibaculum sp.]|uniref:alpha/beta hydrolase family protein n=1 Tax=uncultured Tenacibaculum sp. TaxID=174713 RepID=UPI00262F1482|nr:alpha/beta hydrolase [uncultured Tenacibaculum sp.]